VTDEPDRGPTRLPATAGPSSGAYMVGSAAGDRRVSLHVTVRHQIASPT